MRRFFLIIAITILLSSCANRNTCRVYYDEVNNSVIYTINGCSLRAVNFKSEQEADIFITYLRTKYGATE